MKSYLYIFIVWIAFSQAVQANQFMRVGTVLVRAARSGMQSFRSELNFVNKQPIASAPEVTPEAQSQVFNVKNQQNIAQVLDAVTKATDRPITINIIDAKNNRGNIGSTFVKATTSTKKTEQKFDGSFNQETKSNQSKYHEGHLVGASALTLAIIEFVHYMAR